MLSMFKHNYQLNNYMNTQKRYRKNRVARVYPELSDKPIYILDWYRCKGGLMVHFSEMNTLVTDIKLKVLSIKN